MNAFRNTITLGLAAILFAAAGVAAHGTAKHVMGIASAVEPDRLEVEIRDGGRVSLEIRDETKFLDKGGAATTRDDLRTGDRVVVDYHAEGETKIADEIRFAHPEEKRP